MRYDYSNTYAIDVTSVTRVVNGCVEPAVVLD